MTRTLHVSAILWVPPTTHRHKRLQAVARRKSLSESLINRPAPDSLLERNILHDPEAGQQLAMKRKRLEGLLSERPPPESVGQVLSAPAFSVGVPPPGGTPPRARSPKNSISPRSPRSLRSPRSNPKPRAKPLGSRLL